MTHKNTECCAECYWGKDPEEPAHCVNHNCPCHTPKDTDSISRVVEEGMDSHEASRRRIVHRIQVRDTEIVEIIKEMKGKNIYVYEAEPDTLISKNALLEKISKIKERGI